ncbi:MAG: radical SAM protein [Planctomycetes bacterium]|nr:radical SAM protein [Planctomycetota bacterium]
MDDDRLDLLGMTRGAAIAAARARLVRGAGLAPAIHRMAHREGRFEPERVGASDASAAAWRARFRVGSAVLVRTLEEPDPVRTTRTAKAVLGSADGLEYETVRIPIGEHRESQCVSSQIGCAMGCRFCETALLGKRRDLSPAEIVGQVVLARRELGWQARRIVFQGMGEPLDALDAVATAIAVLGDSHGLGFAQDDFTLCTAGHVDGLRRLAGLALPRVNLSLSLNVADDERRAAIMPIARRWSLAELQAALVALRPRRNWQLGIHVCLMPGINDRRADAEAIAAFCLPLGRVMVHLIPYNPGSAALTRPPDEAELVRYVGWLREAGLPVRRRITKGRSVMAACGQLGNRALRRAGARGFPGQDLNLN